MNKLKPGGSGRMQATAKDLAGIPISEDEDKPTARVTQPGSGKKVCPGKRRGAGNSRPTADDLAGIPVTADGEEDLTVRTRKPRA